MSQLLLTASMTQGNQVVSFSPATDLSSVVVGDLFMVVGINANYSIGSVDNTAKTISLTGNYLGQSDPSAVCILHSSKTVPDNIPFAEDGDKKNLSVIKEGTVKIQEILTDLKTSTTNLKAQSPPATASSAGTFGDVTYDTNYIYVCVATDTWKRSPILTW